VSANPFYIANLLERRFRIVGGRFEVDEVNHSMWHYPDLALDPNFVGTKQRRPYRFEGKRLIFSDKQAPEEDNQNVDRWTIVWGKGKVGPRVSRFGSPGEKLTASGFSSRPERIFLSVLPW
jgi:hypothetical protein